MENIKIPKYTIYLILILFGFIVPFIDTLNIIEMFYFLIPFAIIIIISFVILIASFFTEKINTRKTLYLTGLIPVFILSQLFSGFAVGKIQRLRSEKIIEKIEKSRTVKGEFPDNFDTKIGIVYEKFKSDNRYSISYSRGFLVTENYD